MRIFVAGERSEHLRQLRTLFVGFAGHDRRYCATYRAALDAVVTITIAHHQRAEIRVAESKGAKDVRVLRDFFDRITRVIDQDLLRGDEDTHRGLEPLNVELAVRGLELQQIERCQIAGSVIEKKILATRVGGILPAGPFAGVPL